MPPLTAELAGLAAVVIALLVVALVVDPQARATRRLNRIRRHAAQGCGVCRLELDNLDLKARVAAVEARLAARPSRPAGGKGARR